MLQRHVVCIINVYEKQALSPRLSGLPVDLCLGVRALPLEGSLVDKEVVECLGLILGRRFPPLDPEDSLSRWEGWVRAWLSTLFCRDNVLYQRTMA